MKLARITPLSKREPFTFESLADAETGAPLVVELEPLPIGWDLEIVEKIGVAEAPWKVVGKKRDGEAHVIANTQSARYRVEELRLHAIQVAGMIHLALRHDDRFTWETDPALEKKEPVKFYASLYRELRESPISSGDFSRLIAAVSKSSDVKEEDVEKATRAFLGETGESPSDSSED